MTPLLVVAGLVLLQAGASSLERTFQDAAAALARQDYAVAERGFLAVLKASPNHVGALGNLGVVYSRMNRNGDAIGVYSRALRFAPEEPGLLLNLGLAYLKRDDHARALPLFEKLAKRGNPTAQVRELLATSRLYTGQVEAAMDELGRLRAESPYNSGVLYLLAVGHLRQKNRAAAGEAFGELLRVLKPGPAHYLTGKAYFESGLFDEAAREYRAAAEADAELAGVRLELAKTLTSLRRLDEAAREFREVLKRSPGDAEAAYYLGALLVQGDGVDEGIKLLERVRRENPDSWGAPFYLGKAKLSQGKAAEALVLFREAARLNPDQGAVWMQLSRAAKQAGRTAESQAALGKYGAVRGRERENEGGPVLR